ncbi:Sirohydrochlorin cobaltochelatase [Rhodopirellula islandica]|uniref:Sirohydrochlorin cobaltochelatase n=1 Tax=Rhodopirellula islandica TaxID=595434 RepID=A0A0J1BAS8_RHOIS|nr:sirohydrochlorin chelatase [Rhodopirellula islandica]KLU03601.1 Sirohydrochlorin cobaltochelatase [Rhodopirellula islandica]
MEGRSPAKQATSNLNTGRDLQSRSKGHSSHGILLIGHGTRDQRGTDEFFELGERLASRLAGRAMVQPCLLEFQSPTIDEGWRRLLDAGAERVTVSPLLLFAAGHAKSDIPDAVESVARQTQTLNRIAGYSRPISRQPHMIDLVRERLIESLESAGKAGVGTSPSTAVVMVGRGSLDPCASSDMRLLTEVTLRGRKQEGAHSGTASQSIADRYEINAGGWGTTFYAMAQPRLPDTLEQLAASGRFGRIVVQPHLLFSGRLYDAIVRQTNEVAAKFSEIDFVVSRYLGPDAKVAAAIADRIDSLQSEKAGE